MLTMEEEELGSTEWKSGSNTSVLGKLAENLKLTVDSNIKTPPV